MLPLILGSISREYSFYVPNNKSDQPGEQVDNFLTFKDVGME